MLAVYLKGFVVCGEEVTFERVVNVDDFNVAVSVDVATYCCVSLASEVVGLGMLAPDDIAGAVGLAHLDDPAGLALAQQ